MKKTNPLPSDSFKLRVVCQQIFSWSFSVCLFRRRSTQAGQSARTKQSVCAGRWTRKEQENKIRRLKFKTTGVTWSAEESCKQSAPSPCQSPSGGRLIGGGWRGDCGQRAEEDQEHGWGEPPHVAMLLWLPCKICLPILPLRDSLNLELIRYPPTRIITRERVRVRVSEGEPRRCHRHRFSEVLTDGKRWMDGGSGRTQSRTPPPELRKGVFLSSVEYMYLYLLYQGPLTPAMLLLLCSHTPR